MSFYKVIFLGLTVVGPEEEARLIQGLQKKFNITAEKAESLLQRVPIVVKKGISKEETERYVRAFEEIGGRVRVEEEFTIELPETASISETEQKPPPEAKQYKGPTITCPQCGFVQPETNECIKCGIIISKFRQYQEMARTYENQVREISPEEKSLPWEEGEGFFKAYLKTTWDALFSPSKFFKKVAMGEGYWFPIIYGVISGIIGFGVSFLWQWLFLSRFIPPKIHAFIPLSFSLLLVLIATPFMVVLALFMGSSITHLCLMMVGGNKNGYQATFRAISYSYSAQLFDIIPFIGSFIGSIYTIILFIIGVREGHNISTGRAILAVFLPLIVFSMLIFLALFIPFFFRSMRFLGGVGV